MTTEKPIKDMSLEELQKAEPIMFPKPIHMLTDKELSAKVEDVFDYLHHTPSDLSFDDKELLKEMKRRFDKTLTDDKQLLAEFDDVLMESYPNHTAEVLSKVRDRFLDLSLEAETASDFLEAKLAKMLFYKDLKTPENEPVIPPHLEQKLGTGAKNENFDTSPIDLGHPVHFGSGTDINDLNEALYVVILDPRKYPTPDSQFLYISEQLCSHGASFIARVGLIDTLKSLYDLEGIVKLTPNNQNIIIYWLKNNKVIWGYTLAQDSGDSKAIREIIANSICNLPMGKV